MGSPPAPPPYDPPVIPATIPPPDARTRPSAPRLGSAGRRAAAGTGTWSRAAAVILAAWAVLVCMALGSTGGIFSQPMAMALGLQAPVLQRPSGVASASRVARDESATDVARASARPQATAAGPAPADPVPSDGHAGLGPVLADAWPSAAVRDPAPRPAPEGVRAAPRERAHPARAPPTSA